MNRQRFTGRRLQLLSLLLAAAMAPAMAGSFDFLYIDANEGSASGGHAAIKFGDAVFHFQHIEPGWLRLYRDDFKAFRFAYGYQENRTIRGHRIEVSDAFYQALRDTFERRLVVEELHFNRLKTLLEEHALLQELLDPTDSADIELKSLGYFASAYQADQPLATELFSQLPPTLPAISPGARYEKTESTSTAQLRQQVAQIYGSDFVASKRREIWNRLQVSTPTQPLPNGEITPERFQTDDLLFGQRYKNLLLNLAALDVLQAAPVVRPETFLQTKSPEFRLNPEQVQTLSRFRDTLASDLTQLMVSERPDWGYPLLVGMARLQALDATLNSGYLVVLDRARPDTYDTGEFAEADLPAALQYTQRLFTAASRRLASAEPLDERGYAQVELGVTALLSVQNQAKNDSKARLPTLTTTPSRPATAKLPRLPLTPQVLLQYQVAIEERLQAYRAQLASQYHYDLLARNCVTEIFRIINATAEQQTVAASAADASLQLLGGYIDDNGLNLIPFIAYEQVGARYRVASSFRLPPYRELQIRALQGSTPDWRVDLRESNVFSSTVYAWNGEDAAFVFFTQDAVWPRPLQGSVNLAAAGAEGAFGLLSWPWDGGRHLQKSLKGFAVSLPELVFFNIRKGSFPQLLPDVAPSTE